MKFQVIVSAAPSSLTARQALRYCEAVSASDHQLIQVFFLNAGVLNLLSNKKGSAEPVQAQWLNCNAKEYVCCINAVEEYACAESLEQTDEPSTDIHIAGMAQLISATAEADRSITFGQGS